MRFALRWIPGCLGLALCLPLAWAQLGQQELESGKAALSAGRLAEARRHFRQAVVQAQSERLPRLEAEALYQWSLSLRQEERFAEAQELARQSVEIAMTLREPTLLAQTLHNRAILLHYLGDFQESARVAEEGLRNFRETQDLNGIVRALQLVATNAVARGQWTGALRFYEEALQENFRLKDRFQESSLSTNLGRLYEKMGRYGQAEGFLLRALELDRARGDEIHVSMDLMNLGGLYKNHFQPLKALRYYQEALALATRLAPERWTGILLFNLGTAYTDLGQHQLALEYYRRALTVETRQRSRDGVARNLHNLGWTLARLGRPEEALEQLERALDLSRQIQYPEGMALSLVDLGVVHVTLGQLHRAVARLQEAVTLSRTTQNLDSLWHAWWALARAHRSAGKEALAIQSYDFMVQALLESNRQARAHPHQTSLDPEKWEALEEILAFFLGRGHVERAWRYLESLKRNEIRPVAREMIPESEMLIQYFSGPTTLFAFLATKGDLRGRAHPVGRDALQNQVQRLRESSSSGTDDRKTLHQVSTLLLDAPKGAWHGKDRLLVIPDGPLSELPFELLEITVQRPLLEQCAVVYGTSAGEALASNRETVGPWQAGILMGDPAGAEPSLPGARREIRALQRALSGTRAWWGEAARESTLKRLEGSYAFLHLATHGIVEEWDPSQSHLVLQRDGKEDGRLHAHEVAELKMRAPLVVLNGCETGRGPFHAFGGIIGFAEAFREQKAQTLLTTLWKIPDAPSPLLKLFYRNLRQGWDCGEALRRAKLELRTQPRFRDPRWWAPLVLYGNSKLKFTSPRQGRERGWEAGTSLIVMGMLVLLCARRRRASGRS
ncbi:MAG: CHAT domain-containing protein [Acidobacteria bacterium]|nr:CHAT domain-containing protein [Acidobacteriota bacterium]